MLPVTAASAVAYNAANQKGFFDGVFGCLRPVLSFIGKATVAEMKQQGGCRNFNLHTVFFHCCLTGQL